jgi:hypothetical protein
MRGFGQTWEESNKIIMERLESDIKTRERGDDAYKRWPLDTMLLVRARFVAMQKELDGFNTGKVI